MTERPVGRGAIPRGLGAQASCRRSVLLFSAIKSGQGPYSPPRLLAAGGTRRARRESWVGVRHRAWAPRMPTLEPHTARGPSPPGEQDAREWGRGELSLEPRSHSRSAARASRAT